MTPTQAAKAFLDEHARRKAADAEYEEAKKVLKAHFAKTGKPAFKGVAYTCATYSRFDQSIAKELLGAKAAKCMVAGTRETLTPAARP